MNSTEDEAFDAPMVGTKAALTTMPYQTQECILYGSVNHDFVADLERRLAGLCDHGSTDFHEHEMSFSLKTGISNDPDVCIRLRRRFNLENNSSHQNLWQFRYIGGPEPDQKCPVIVRKVIDSITYSYNMMEFVKTIGLRMDYEFIARGTAYTCGKIKIIVSALQKSEKAGNYDNLKRLSDSYLVEMSISLPESSEYTQAAKQLRDFADQLLPLVHMQKEMSDPCEINIDDDDDEVLQEPVAESNEQSEEASSNVAKEEMPSTTDDIKSSIKTEEITDGKRKIKVAVVGCSHGELDVIYGTLEEIERQNGFKFELVLCCGDFQSVRNYGDLQHMHVPDKFKALNTFYKYYSLEKTAPILTVFIGGNHEASGYLSELPYGGWVAPNIYYMGFASVINFAGLRIAGLSGIFKEKDYHKGHFERPPYDRYSDIVSTYHVRNFDIWRLKQMKPKENDKNKNSVDVMLTHDWPCGITDFGNVNNLLRFKPHFAEDIEANKLGNPGTMMLLYDIKPCYWFAGHLHAYFPALVPHAAKNEGERPDPTRFLALDKPIPRRHFVHTVELEVDANATTDLKYDSNWIAILKSTDHLTSTDYKQTYLPSSHSNERFDFRPTDEELSIMETYGDLTIPKNFRPTAPPVFTESLSTSDQSPSLYYKNPQTTEFCSRFNITDINQVLLAKTSEGVGTPFHVTDMTRATKASTAELRLNEQLFQDTDFVIDTRPSVLGNDIPTNGNDFLEGFTAPAWKGKTEAPEDKDSEASEEKVFKRRKVDLDES
ncbi:unnamed protein product [Auanema sp. JU1783]|nr:unnamed protein product [Auanema sp. JU1783]